MIRCLAIAALSLTGVVHLIIGPGQFSHAFAHGVFFILTGTAQLLWALAFWRYSSLIFCWAGLTMSGGIINVWILSHWVSVPFALTAHAIGPMTVVVTCSELVGFVALVGLIGRGQLTVFTGRSVVRLVGGALALTLVFGAVVWGGGHLVEVMVAYEAPGSN